MSTGKGVTFIIMCEQIPKHDWMSFASWYSISKNLPDAKVIVAVKRVSKQEIPIDMFRWPGKCGVQVAQYKKNLPKFDDQIIWHIEPTVMAIRSGNELSVTSSKSSEQTVLVDYSDGVGCFVVQEWIDNVLPFSRAIRRWAIDNLSVNEIAILNLWQRCGTLYEVL